MNAPTGEEGDRRYGLVPESVQTRQAARCTGAGWYIFAGQVNGDDPFDATFQGVSQDGSGVFFCTVGVAGSGRTDMASGRFRGGAGPRYG